MVRVVPPLAPVVSSSPVRVRGEDDLCLRADLAVNPDNDKNVFLAILSSLMLMLEVSSLVTIALICRSDRHTCQPV